MGGSREPLEQDHSQRCRSERDRERLDVTPVCHDVLVPEPVDLLERPTYSMSQVDRLLSLKSGTARRWIDGYQRGGKFYEPVVRPERTDHEIVTWGEFVETRLLSEYRDAGVPMLNLRPAILRLREQFGAYPLARAKPFVQGRQLVHEIQADVNLPEVLRLVVVSKNDQLVLSESARNFYNSLDYSVASDSVALRVRPQRGNDDVLVDPLRQFGEPVVRSVPTDVIAEQVRAGDHIESIAALFDLTVSQVESAIRYELWRSRPVEAA